MRTDAADHLVLVDALRDVQRQHKPKSIVDSATLSGAIVTALANDFGGLCARRCAGGSNCWQPGP